MEEEHRTQILSLLTSQENYVERLSDDFDLIVLSCCTLSLNAQQIHSFIVFTLPSLTVFMMPNFIGSIGQRPSPDHLRPWAQLSVCEKQGNLQPLDSPLALSTLSFIGALITVMTIVGFTVQCDIKVVCAWSILTPLQCSSSSKLLP